MTAVQLALRGHHVLLCEQREAYTRNRFIGVYKEVAHLMAALGMPESMTYDFTHYRGKRGIMLADIQTFLHSVALKVGVIVYTGAAAQLSPEGIRDGELDLLRSTRTGGAEPSGIGLTRWHHDSVARVRSGVSVRFDTIVEATGGRSGLRELLVGDDNVVSLQSIARSAAAQDPSLSRFFDDPEDHCAEFVESEYGCPPELRSSFAAALRSDVEEIPDELPCFVSNIDASIVTKPLRPTEKAAGAGAQIGDAELAIPPDWVVVQCPLSDGRLTRYQIEGPLPQSFEFGGQTFLTREWLDRLNPVSLLVRVLYAMGVPFDAVNRSQLVGFYNAEASRADASDVVAVWMGTFRGVRVGGEEPRWVGFVPGSTRVRYGIVGEALQNAWYRFGVGVDDTFAAATRFAEGTELEPGERRLRALRFEAVMLTRSVQVLYHLYGVAQHGSQGVVGAVLTEYHMEQQRNEDLATARLREAGRSAAEMIAVEDDLRCLGTDDLLEAALDDQVQMTYRSVVASLESIPRQRQRRRQAAQPAPAGASNSRRDEIRSLAEALPPEHRELLRPLLDRALAATPPGAGRQDPRQREERLIDLGLGRYGWAGPWLRACALRLLDPSSPAALSALSLAVVDLDLLVSETATAVLSGGSGDRSLTIDKVLLLHEVALFAAVPHQELVAVAALLTESWASPGERIFSKGDLGQCLYLIDSGAVSVHDGVRVLNQLGPKRYFGEMSILDARPRSADLTAVEPSHLFRLDQADFHTLMMSRPEIVHAINRALCQEVRRLSNGVGHD